MKKKTSGEKEYKGSRYAEFGVEDDKNFKSKCWESIRVGIWRFLKERKNHMPACMAFRCTDFANNERASTIASPNYDEHGL